MEKFTWGNYRDTWGLLIANGSLIFWHHYQLIFAWHLGADDIVSVLILNGLAGITNAKSFYR